MSQNSKVRKQTIKDFNNQWKLQGELNKDYWASDEILIDQFNNIFDLNQISNKIVGDIGAGTGRVVRTLLNFNPKKVFAVEPSDVGIKKIKNDFIDKNNLKIIQSDGLNFQTDDLCDFIFSLGVIHHIKDTTDVLINIRKNLKKNGQLIIWVYGYENNLPYIIFYKIISKFTKYLPDRLLYILANILNLFLQIYIFFCKFINLPLKDYLLKVFNKFGWTKQTDVIFDQLNPQYAKYYKKEEILKELKDAGFKDLKISHRHNYSWTVVGKN